MKNHIFAKRSSLQARFVVFYLVSFFLIASVIFGCNSYYKRQLTKRAISLSEDTLLLHINSLDTQLDNVSSFLTNFLLLDNNHRILSESDNPNEQLNAMLAVNETLEEQISLNSNISGLIFYAPWSDVLLMEGDMQESVQDRLAIRDYIKNYYRETRTSEDEPSIMKWTPVFLNNHTFLLSVASFEHVYIASWYRIETILSPLTSLPGASEGTYYLSDTQVDAPLFSVDSQRVTPEEHATLANNATAISVSSAENNYSLWIYLSESFLMTDYGTFFTVLLIMLFVFLILILSNVLLLREQVLHPVSVITHGMKCLQKGNFDTRLSIPDTNNEFREMMSTFNYMGQEIQHLKVRLYEEKLEKANTELEYLTLQIKPHFYLNCLNVIYSLNLSGHTELISQMTSYLMIYFRYLFKSSSSLVPLSEELEHVSTYLRIQELRSSSEFHTEYEIPESLTAHPIPVLSVQTFVENIFKHACSDTDDVLISISAAAACVDGQEYLHIRIQDNGPGFPPQHLSTLNDMHSTLQTETGKHVGINNIKHRLLSIYSGKAKLIFSNDEEGGAVVDFLIP